METVKPLTPESREFKAWCYEQCGAIGCTARNLMERYPGAYGYTWELLMEKCGRKDD